MAVTIRDVAKAAGTSISTVSKVINRHYSISEATAERVRQVMEEMVLLPSVAKNISPMVDLQVEMEETVEVSFSSQMKDYQRYSIFAITEF